MSDTPNEHGQTPEFLRVVLVVVALMVLLGGCAVAGLTLQEAGAHPGTSSGQTLSVAIAALLGGVLLASLAFAASAALGILSTVVENQKKLPAPREDVRPSLHRLEQSLRTLNAIQSRDTGGARETLPAGGTNIAPLLGELRDFTLMSDEQRQRFAVRHWNRRRDVLTELIERDVLIGDWVTAFSRLEDLQLLLPDDSKVEELRERVESEQSARLEEELRTAQSQLRHLVGIASWQQAEELTGELQRKYPRKSEPVQLADDLRREREAYEREAMEKLFRDVASATERRQWRSAVLALEEFIRRYPNDPRAEKLRLDLPMLTENAAAHERKEQEEAFKELLKKQRYQEAIAMARGVIQKYPNSPTATELTKLLPRVEEMARQEAVKLASVAAVQGAAGVVSTA